MNALESDPNVTLRALSPEEAVARISDLATILIDCVAMGASVTFMPPLLPDRAEAFWRGVAEGVAAGDRVLLVAEDSKTGVVVGTVQMVPAPQENQPHRGEIAKMLVSPYARRRGIGAALMRAAEEAARAAGRTLLVLDTVTDSDGHRLYERLGWIPVGTIPEYALFPNGEYCDATFFYKRLA